MTPNDKQKLKNGAQMRSLDVLTNIEAEGEEEKKYIVEGYAARFAPYVLYEDVDGTPVYEQFDRNCFDTADMRDIILQYDHCGKVYARTSNDTLRVSVDDNGLKVWADLSRTESSRELFEEISTGMITKMSWRFSLGDYDYNPETKTFCHHSVKKVYDVSAVSIPANDSTEINARTWADGEIALVARREAELDHTRNKLKLKIKMNEVH